MAGGPVQNFNNPGIPVLALVNPPEGRRVISSVSVLTPDDFSISNQQLLNSASMSQVVTLQIDNSQNPQALTVQHGAALSTTVVPAGGGAIIPTTSSIGGQTYPYFFSAPQAPADDVDVRVTLYNYVIPPASYGSQVIVVPSALPIGSIIGWYGSVASIPVGYGLCDGTVYNRSDGAGTITSPDLRNTFELGAGGSFAPGDTGGSDTISQANLPNVALPVTDPGHNHGVTDPGHLHILDTGQTAGGGSNAMFINPGTIATAISLRFGQAIEVAMTGISIIAAATGLTVRTGGTGAQFVPPYYAVCKIMKF